MPDEDRLLHLFLAQGEAFEQALANDDWSRFEEFFTEDAVYETLGRGGERFEGRPEVIAGLRRAVTSFDRRCDSRRLESTTGPVAQACEVTRSWACTFAVHGAPDLVIEGDERAVYRGDLIQSLQERLTPASRARLESWVHCYAGLLRVPAKR